MGANCVASQARTTSSSRPAASTATAGARAILTSVATRMGHAADRLHRLEGAAGGRTGGSAAFSLLVREPAFFTSRLAAGPSRVEVLNTGVVGCLGGSELALVAHELLDLGPDYVVDSKCRRVLEPCPNRNGMAGFGGCP